MRLVARDLFAREGGVVGDHETHLRALVDWLCLAQDVREGRYDAGGVSAGWCLAAGWLPSYPETSGTWELTVLIWYRGFWIVQLYDGFFTFKSAGVGLRCDLMTEQYFPIHDQQSTLVSKNKTDGYSADLFSLAPFQWMRAPLRRGDRVWVRARTRMVAYAHGSGSYAELNLAAGQNSITPIALFATPV